MLLVERATLLDRLRTAAESAQSGGGALIAVSGEAGAGKTSLAREALPGALWGYCEPLSTPRPLGPFRDLAPELWPDDPDAAALPVAELRETLLDRLRGAAVVMVIEDAHWIDDASADVLRFLGRRIATTNALIVVTFRDELSADHPLRPVLGELSSTRSVSRMNVAPLSPAGVAELVSGSALDPDEAFRLTDGNPFLLNQLMSAGRAEPASTVRDAIAARTARLSPPAREIVELLSVMPGRVPAGVLGPDWAHLDEPVRAGLLQVDGSVVAFRHELVRLAVEQDLTPGRTQELHGEVVRRLLAGPDPEPTAIAFHARRAHDHALAYASDQAAAERAVALGSHRAAAQHYRQAVTDAEGFAPAAELARLCLALSREEYLIGHDAESAQAARQAVELCPVGTDPLLRGEAMRWLSRMSPSEAECHRLGLVAIDILEPLGPTRQLAAAYANLATNRMLARDLDAATSWSRRAIELATQVGDAESLVSALQALGCVETLSGADPECQNLRQAVRVGHEAGVDGELGRAYANLVSAAGEAKLYAQSAAAAEEALAYFVARDLDSHAAYTRAWHARCRFEQGRWSEATEALDEILAGTAEAGTIAGLTALTIRGRIRARRGDPDVWTPLTEAKRQADVVGALQRIAPVAAARAEARWLVGNVDDGSDGLQAAYDLAVELDNAWNIGELGLWLWRHGRLSELPARAAEPYALHVNGDPLAAGRAWAAIGCPYEAADAWADSGDADSVRRALETFTDVGALPGRRRAAQRLRELGVRSIPRGPRDSTAADPNGLTAREQEVLGWLRGGHSDAEIAAGLHLSAKTVGHHVSAVLRKTGSRSRRDLQDRRGER